MKKIKLFALLLILLFFNSCYKKEIKEYVNFLKEQNTSSVDYILGLFDHYDIVILCERNHQDITQYELFYQLVSDQRFINKVGNIFTEVGGSNYNDNINNILKNKNLTDRELKQKLLKLYRDFHWGGVWEKYNFFDFLNKLYYLNSQLEVEKKLNLYFTDIPINWQNITSPQQFEKIIRVNRDLLMGNYFNKKFNAICNSNAKRKKALVIMNYRHAFKNFKYANGELSNNTGEYIYKAFPDQTANVMVNSLALMSGSKDRKAIYDVIQEGKWDAAFEVLGNPEIGFDFANSPFGNDYFDYFTFKKHNSKYKDIFTGFVFYKPLSEHELVMGVPGIMDNGYIEIYKQRDLIMYGDTISAEKIMQNNFKKTSKYEKLNKYLEKIFHWVE